MNYLEFSFRVEPLQPGCEILIAQLGAIGFESFVETQVGVDAYIPSPDFNENLLEQVQILDSSEFQISYDRKEIEQVNWNEEWEKNFQPILVDNTCSVRAPFHPKPNARYDIVIEPKMSFGTGHHATTYLMIKFLLETDLQGKDVLDMGCGTGVLGILAELKGASKITAIDIDNWSYLNALENAERNGCTRMQVFEGGAELLDGSKFDVIIANINRNILLEDMKVYAESLDNGSELFLSGFYREDIPAIEEECERYGLNFVTYKERENWVATKFVK